MQGSVDKKRYARHIPGNGEYAAVCMKPELSKKTKKKKAAHPTCKSFTEMVAICKNILNNPAARAMWEERYEEAKRKARRHNKPIQGRLCDFVKHEVSEALKRGDLTAWFLAFYYILIVVTSEEASDEHPFSIRSASDGTSRRPRGKEGIMS